MNISVDEKNMRWNLGYAAGISNDLESSSWSWHSFLS